MGSNPAANKNTFNKHMSNLLRYTLSYTRAFGDGPRYLEPSSSDRNDTGAGTPSPNYPTPPSGGHLSSRQI
ncbi:hypothetical protein TNCV_250731 [Trichonephila clavipes]|nr:hypothetical protein TNCV_250731 [Trichonephila clavipes]